MGWWNKSLFTWPRWPPCPNIVKTLKIFFSGTKMPVTLKLGMQNRVLEYYQVCSNDDPGLTLTCFTVRSNLVLYAFVWEKGQTNGFFRNYCSLWFETSNRWPKWQDFSVDINFVPWSLYAPCPRIIHILNHEKKCIKSDFKEISLKLATNV